MSLLALAASAALSVAAQPAHSVNLDHRGSTYRVDYRPHVETRLRTIGMSAGPRPSTQKCVVIADVSVERVIAGQSGQELKALLTGRQSFTEHLPGSCHGRDAGTIVAAKSDSIGAHLARAAAADRPAALAAIDSAHHFAAN
jgi:hypothetical protein